LAQQWRTAAWRRPMRLRKLAARVIPSSSPTIAPTPSPQSSQTADVATLIGGSSNVASAFLGPRDMVFGTAILGNNDFPDGPVDSFTFSESSTFDFSYGGDLLLGVIDGDFSVIINGVQVLAEDSVDDGVINLGSNFGPNIDLTIVSYGSGDFVLGGAVPEPSTWAMMALGFAGLRFMGWRGSRKTIARAV
jgi:PEP-CTERM motif